MVDGLLGRPERLLALADLAQASGQVVEGRCEIGPIGIGRLGRQLAVQVRGLLGRPERLLALADLAQANGQVVQGRSEHRQPVRLSGRHGMSQEGSDFLGQSRCMLRESKGAFGQCIGDQHKLVNVDRAAIDQHIEPDERLFVACSREVLRGADYERRH